jgi:hypothetical protein
LYGSKLDSIKVDALLFVMSAGCTQVALYLEEDTNLLAPNILQSIAHFLWLWKLVTTTVGYFITKEMVQRKLQENKSCHPKCWNDMRAIPAKSTRLMTPFAGRLQ